MKASKSLTSILAAAAVVGVISLAYAQTADTTAPSNSSGQALQNQGTGSPDASVQTPSPSTTDTAVTATERPAQADRN